MTAVLTATLPALTLHRAESFAARLFGLLARAPLGPNEALVLAPCASVHTAFMRYPIDVAFVDCEGRVLKVAANLRPFRAAWCPGAYAVVEFAAGAAFRHGATLGSAFNIAP
jgi:uncharacterized protein